jgi:hypothetical protein
VENAGGEATQTHEVVKSNFYQTQMGLLQRLNHEAQATLDDLLNEVAARPDAFWYDHSLKDRLAAHVLGAGYLEMEDRGLPRLTFRERLRQVALGDVVDAKTAVFDRWQAAERRAAQAIGLPAGNAVREDMAALLSAEDE